MSKYRYYIPEFGETAEDAEIIETDFSTPSLIAEECAEYDYSHRDGWDHEWPVVYVIMDESGNELGRFNVELEEVPSFSACEVKKEVEG